MDTLGPTKRILIIVGVLIVQATEVLPMGPQIIVWVMQVSLFSSIHIDRVHCRGVTMIRHFSLSRLQYWLCAVPGVNIS